MRVPIYYWLTPLLSISNGQVEALGGGIICLISDLILHDIPQGFVVQLKGGFFETSSHSKT